MRPRERHAEKLRLLYLIQEQRADLTDECDQWLVATAPYDRGWIKLMGMKKYLAIGSSLMAVYTARHPNKVMQWGRRAVGIWGTVKLIRNTLSPR
ncbi:MAG: YqjK-like family protein [Yersiniaceae bacterium]|uniref:Cell division protein FtsH n=1 Tax=Chimaeribacter coloradensis TaxID=2060068 RepID=A0A2N5E8W7_9GAMM|nr:YqjK-like family protein [Chimaeribacter coloradensis]MDU6410120.1 YqjK-like family protein [Yersiniaceae bacterium]PLR38352.1 cell division protein FtsH [Chimaeribacter coloradensis]